MLKKTVKTAINRKKLVRLRRKLKHRLAKSNRRHSGVLIEYRASETLTVRQMKSETLFLLHQNNFLCVTFPVTERTRSERTRIARKLRFYEINATA
jgi:hypothetical protein